MTAIPQANGFDHTVALLREGYEFIGNRCRELGSDVFEARLMLRRVICMQGADAAECFYQPDRLTRVGAIPITVTKLLQGFGSVQLLDDDAHRTRKGMFLSLLTEERSRELSVITEAEWRLCLQRWQAAPRVVLFDELWGLLTRAALKWVRMPLEPAEAEKRAEEFQAMIEGTGSLGPRAWAGLLLRSRCDRWARGVIRQVRAGTIAAPKGSALWVVANTGMSALARRYA